MEDFNLTNAENEILSILVKSEKPLSVRDIVISGTMISRYYIYEVLSNLSKNNLVILHGNKPMKYSSSKKQVEGYIKIIRAEKKKQIDALKSIDIDILNLNETQIIIFKIINDGELNIKEIAKKMQSELNSKKDQTSLVERNLKILFNRNYIDRVKRGKSLKYYYYARSIEEICLEVSKSLNENWVDCERRIKKWLKGIDKKDEESEDVVSDFFNLTLGNFFSHLNSDLISLIFEKLPTNFRNKYDIGIERAKELFIKVGPDSDEKKDKFDNKIQYY